VLAWTAGGVAAVVAAGAVGVDLVSAGVLPGKRVLDAIDGACSVPSHLDVAARLGPFRTGQFHSSARGRTVGYTIAWPPGTGPGRPLPLVVALHGYGVSHTQALSAVSLAQAPAVRVGGKALPPFAVVAADGGGGYWHAHPGDDPMGMLVDELVPMCQRLGLGRPPQRLSVVGISMGGYGALLMAQKAPSTIAAVAAISPAIWRSYDAAHSANAGAFSSAADFAANDVIAHAGRLADIPTRVASGNDDPFHAGVEAFAAAAPASTQVEFSKGCHSGPFFAEQLTPSLAFVAGHLS
jgi:S-formylglutathione hydrolase FrmB